MVIAQTLAIPASAWIGILLFAVGWIGTLVWWSAKMTAYREKTDTDIGDMRKKLDAVSEHFVSKESFETSITELCRRIGTLEDIKLGERLATIETNQDNQGKTLYQIQTTLAEIQKYLRK